LLRHWHTSFHVGVWSQHLTHLIRETRPQMAPAAFFQPKKCIPIPYNDVFHLNELRCQKRLVILIADFDAHNQKGVLDMSNTIDSPDFHEEFDHFSVCRRWLAEIVSNVHLKPKILPFMDSILSLHGRRDAHCFKLLPHNFTLSTILSISLNPSHFHPAPTTKIKHKEVWSCSSSSSLSLMLMHIHSLLHTNVSWPKLTVCLSLDLHLLSGYWPQFSLTLVRPNPGTNGRFIIHYECIFQAVNDTP